MNLRCFLTVLLVNNPGQLIEFMPREVYMLFFSFTKQILTFLRRPNEKKKRSRKSLDRTMRDKAFFLSSGFFFHYCIDGLSTLSTPREIPLQKTDKLDATTATDRAPCTLVEKFAKRRPVTLAQVKEHRLWSLYSDDSLDKVTGCSNLYPTGAERLYCSPLCSDTDFM